MNEEEQVPAFYSAAFVSQGKVYKTGMREDRWPLKISVREMGDFMAIDHFIIGVRANTDEPYIESDLMWATTPNKGVYHSTEKRER